LVREKAEIAANRIIKEFEGSDIQVLNGRFGPYLSDGKMNGKIPKDRDPASLTFEEVQQLMAETGKPVRKGFGRKATNRKAADGEAKSGTSASTATKKSAKKTAKKTTKKAAKKTTAKKATKPASKASGKKVAAKSAAKAGARKSAATGAPANG